MWCYVCLIPLPSVHHLSCSAHKKNKNWGHTMPHTDLEPVTTAIFVYDTPQFCHNSGVTANHKTHHPAMGS